MMDLIDRNLIGDLVDSNGNVHYEDIMNIPSLELPPVQPVDKDINVSCKDAIDRQAAIDAFKPYADYESNRTNADWVRRIELVLNDLPPAQPELKWNRLMLFLADLQLAYSPGWGANGCGDQNLYDFITGLIKELEGWTDETA